MAQCYSFCVSRVTSSFAASLSHAAQSALRSRRSHAVMGWGWGQRVPMSFRQWNASAVPTERYYSERVLKQHSYYLRPLRQQYRLPKRTTTNSSFLLYFR